MNRFWHRLLLGTASRQVHYECRHCGDVVDGDTDVCPACGRRSIARYEIS
ncbi:hypothetical protein [Halorientalis sp. IM1011]|nr:hypothetical protein [Halorientalis sp. IM1011]